MTRAWVLLRLLRRVCWRRRLILLLTPTWLPLWLLVPALLLLRCRLLIPTRMSLCLLWGLRLLIPALRPLWLLSPVLLGDSLLCGCLALCMSGTCNAVIANVAPDIQGYQHHQDNKDHDVKGMEVSRKGDKVAANICTNKCKEQGPGKRAQESVDAKLCKCQLCDTSGNGEIGTNH